MKLSALERKLETSIQMVDVHVSELRKLIEIAKAANQYCIEVESAGAVEALKLYDELIRSTKGVSE